MRLVVHVIAVSALALAGACAHKPASQAEIDQLNSTIESLRLQNSAYAKQVEELENRVFILSDRLDSRKVNDERTELPTLPTVALHPETTAAAMAVPMAPAGTETDAEPVVEYVGEAAKSSAHRPVLRLHGDSAEVMVTRVSNRPPATVRVAHESQPRPPKDDHPEVVAMYRKSFEALRAGRNEEAVQGFRDIARQYPDHDLADNAQYWLGECFYDRKDYAQAVREFRRVIEHYPSGNKVPDALLKVGFSYLALGSTEAGKQTLSQLQRSYPRHEAATLATARLAELNHSTPARPASNAATAAASAGKGSHAPEEAP
jgi:tol-pal system protein YbgF